jgi:hypothetical protein
MKNIKLLIIILSILVIGLIITLAILRMESKNTKRNVISNNITPSIENNINNDIISPKTTILTFNTSIEKETSNSVLYSLNRNINKYFNYIKENNETAINELGGNSIYLITNNVKYVVKQAYVTQNQYMSKYYTYGTLTIANGNYTAQTQEIYMILYLTAENKGYRLQTISKEEYLNRTALEQNDTIEIQEGTYNKFEYEYIDNVKQMEIYLEDYSFQIFNNTENSYNLLNTEYKEKRFKDLQAFVQFLNEKQGQLHNIKINQYTVDEENQNKIYKGTDQNGNYYEIIEKSYMNYEIILDNYTMLDYSNDSDENKIKLSAEKFILMLNSADYTNAYNLLEPSFKQINFPTEQDFINYVKNNFYARNIVASKDLSEDGICTVTIKDSISTQANKIQKQFKVIMGEGMSFTIEFNI